VTPQAVAQFLVVAALAAPSLVLDPPTRGAFTPAAVAAVLVTGVYATALAVACQLYAQRRLAAVEVAVVLTLEPVAAVATSILVGREEPTLGLLAGGGLLVAGMLLSELASPPPATAVAPAPRSKSSRRVLAACSLAPSSTSSTLPAVRPPPPPAAQSFRARGFIRWRCSRSWCSWGTSAC
jgi:hypothetical protein